MDPFRRSQSADSAEREKSSCSGSLSVLPKDQITDLLWYKTSLQKPTIPYSDESRYLITLWVSANEHPREEQLYQSVSSQSIITCIEPKDELFVPVYQKIEEKIRAALKLLTFREEHVLVQFWSPRVVGKHQLLTTADQPFGVGVIDEGLLFYRKNSERNVYLVDKDDEEEDISPPARVFRRGLPEWTSDLTNYRPNDFLQQECAIRCNLHGYLALPVFDSTTELCVGVIELLMSSTNTTNAFEVQQVHKALKTVNLTSPQVYDIAIPKVLNEWRQNELDKILGILKSMCDIHNLPLAQTWVVSPSTTFVSHDKIIEKSCSSFDTRCIGKVCLSTNALPFYVRDLRVWPFREACKEQHLDKSRSFVARALLAPGLYYCQDVTQLSEEEYPLVHNARMSGLKSCFTIFLHSIEGNDDYVFEFYLPSDIEDASYLVQTLKQNIVVASGFELGDISPIQFIGSPQSIQISSTTTANTMASGMNSSDLKSVFTNVVKSDNKQGDISNNYNLVASKANDNGASHPIVINKKTMDTIVKSGRKRKIDSLKMEEVKQHVGKPIDEAAKSFGVSRSTLKRFCRVNGLSSWPKPKQSKKTTNLTNSKPSQELSSIQRFQQYSSPCAFSGESRYLTQLWVSGKADELSQSTTTADYELMAAEIDPHNQLIVEDKIKAVLKLLTFRELRVLVQFWSPRVVGKHQLLTSIDQPFGLGVIDEGLLLYRKDSVHNSFVVAKDDEDEDASPIARVFKLGLSEWSSDLANYLPKHFPQQECAIRCNLHGYLALPVSDSTTRLCVGVLELLASSKYTSFDYEVQQFEKALKTQKLTCLQVLDDPASNVNELEEIFKIMKVVCDTHQLPLAQTWALSPFTSVASYEQDLKKSCNSYDTICLGNVCMSTCALPFHVEDLALWPFREECKKQHLDKSRGFISKALSSGSCFCEDVTKLSKEVYPLVHYARKSGLTSWFAICLHGLESNNDYVLEFFLPSHMKESKHILNYVLKVAPAFELGDKSSIKVAGPLMDLCVNKEPDIVGTSSYMMDTNARGTSSSLKKGTKRKRGTKVTITYGEDIKRFRFCISQGLLKLKNKVAKRFKLESEMIRLKYKDEDDDLILLCGDYDLQPDLVASGSNKNTINLLCELSA